MIIRTLKYFLARAIGGVAYFVCSIIIVSNYSSEEYGVYSVAITSAQFFSIIFTSWVGLSANLTIPGLAEKKILDEKIKIYSCLGFICCSASAIFLGLAYYFSVISLPHSFIIPSIIFCFAFGFHESQMSITNARRITDAYSISTIVRYLSGLVAVWIAVNLTFSGRENALLGLAIGSLIALALPVIWAQAASGFSANVAILRNSFREIVFSGASSMMVFGLWTFATYASRISLHSSGQSVELGSFAITTDLLNGPIVLAFQAVHLAWAPAVVAAMNSGNLERFRSLSSEYLGALVVLALPGLAIVWFLGSSLLAFLTGGERDSTTDTLISWITATTILSSIFGASGLILLTSGYKKVVVSVAFIVLILNFKALSFFGDTALSSAQVNVITVGFGVIILFAVLIVKFKIFFNKQHIISAIFTSIFICVFLMLSDKRYFSQNVIEYLTYCLFFVVVSYTCLNTFSCRTKLYLAYNKFRYKH